MKTKAKINKSINFGPNSLQNNHIEEKRTVTNSTLTNKQRERKTREEVWRVDRDGRRGGI